MLVSLILTVSLCQKVIVGALSATEFFFKYCDGKLTDADVNAQGNKVASAYFGDDALYLDDYCHVIEYELYERTENDLDFNKLKEKMDSGLTSGILTKAAQKASKPWWKFWYKNIARQEKTPSAWTRARCFARVIGAMLTRSYPVIKGNCLCGKVSYEYLGDIKEIAMCHCSQCRQAQGSAFATNSPVDSDKLHFSGKEFIKEFQSNKDKVRAFCLNCGSPLYSALRTLPNIKRLRIGTIKTNFSCENKYHIFSTSKAPWHSITDSYPQYRKLKNT